MEKKNVRKLVSHDKIMTRMCCHGVVVPLKKHVHEADLSALDENKYDTTSKTSLQIAAAYIERQKKDDLRHVMGKTYWCNERP